MSEPADTSRAGKPGHDPNYILSQDEFGSGMRTLHGALSDNERRTREVIGHEFRALEEAFGWICLSFAFWVALIGYYALKGDLRKP